MIRTENLGFTIFARANNGVVPQEYSEEMGWNSSIEEQDNYLARNYTYEGTTYQVLDVREHYIGCTFIRVRNLFLAVLITLISFGTVFFHPEAGRKVKQWLTGHQVVIILATPQDNLFHRWNQHGEDDPFGMSPLPQNVMSIEQSTLQHVRQNGLALQSVGNDLKNNEAIVRAAVEQNGLALQFASNDLKNNEDIVRAAVEQNGPALEFASNDLKNNQAIVRAAVEQNGLALRFASNDLKNNEAIVRAAVEQNGRALQFADDDLKNNPAVVDAAIEQNVFAIRYASEVLRGSEVRIHAAIEKVGTILKYADTELKKDKAIVRAAVVRNYTAFKYADPTLQDDEELLCELGEITPRIFEYASDRLKGKRDVALRFVQKSPWLFVCVSGALKHDEELAVAAVQQDGRIFGDANGVPRELRSNKTVALAAIRNYSFALDHANPEIKTDEDLVLLAFCVYSSKNAPPNNIFRFMIDNKDIKMQDGTSRMFASEAEFVQYFIESGKIVMTDEANMTYELTENSEEPESVDRV